MYNGYHFQVDAEGNLTLEGEDEKEEKTTEIYAKLYTNGTDDTLVLSSNADYVYNANGLTLKEDYGNIGNEKYFIETTSETYIDEETGKEVRKTEEKGNIPPWLEQKTSESVYSTYINKNITYENSSLKKVVAADSIDLLYPQTYFYKCYNLTNLEGMQNVNTEKATDMSYLFYNCRNLSDISGLSQWDTSNVTNMSFLFAACHTLTDINDLSSWDTGK